MNFEEQWLVSLLLMAKGKHDKLFCFFFLHYAHRSKVSYH